MIASLPMYDTPVTAGANDRLWQAIRQELGRGPPDLDRREDPHATWCRADLLFSQTCGLPYRHGLHRHVQLIGTPDYGVAGCPPGYYRSMIVTRATDPRDDLAAFTGARLARNDVRSQSGWAAMVQEMRDADLDWSFAAGILDTGSHAASAEALRRGDADIAAIDAVTWALLARDTKGTAGLRVLTQTAPTPGLPFIAAQGADAAGLFRAVRRALTAIDSRDRECLMLKGIVQIAAEEYRAVPLP